MLSREVFLHVIARAIARSNLPYYLEIASGFALAMTYKKGFALAMTYKKGFALAMTYKKGFALAMTLEHRQKQSNIICRQIKMLGNIRID